MGEESKQQSLKETIRNATEDIIIAGKNFWGQISHSLELALKKPRSGRESRERNRRK